MTLKKFIKYFDKMTELCIMTFINDDNGIVLFKGYTFDKGAKKKLKKLYSEGWVLERNDDGEAVMLFPYRNEHNADLCKAQINVTKRKRRKK